MPATAGRVRMPANNRVHSSAALQTHGIWQSTIGYDPYAPEKDSSSKPQSASKGEPSDPDGGSENAYASFQGLLALARITGSNADDTRGACKKCGRVGHLTFQCRNFLSVKEDKEKDDLALQTVSSVLHKIKKANGMKKGEEESSEEEEESESSDSDADSEIERVIAARSGKMVKKKKTDDEDSNKKKERRRRPKKRHGRRRHGSSDEDEEVVRRKEKKRRRRHVSSDDDDVVQADRRHQHHRKSRKEKKRSRHPRRVDSDDESGDDLDRHRHHRKGRSRPREASGSESSEIGSGLDDGKRSNRHKEKHRHHHQGRSRRGGGGIRE